jgi:LPXTG-site transpeptidase (sortase) family protein
VTAIVGVGIWILSFPLVTAHGAPAAAVATTVPAAADTMTTPVARQFRTVRPPLVLGELAVPVVAELLRPPVVVVVPAWRPPVAAPAPSRPAPPAPAPAPVTNTLTIPRLGLHQHVSPYTDCTGATGVPHWDVWQWTCAGVNNTYLMAHNPGIFTPILAMKVGDIIEYAGADGVVHTYRVTFTEIVPDTDTSVMSALGVPSITLQTCWNFDGTQDFIVRAVQV